MANEQRLNFADFEANNGYSNSMVNLAPLNDEVMVSQPSEPVPLDTNDV